MEEKIINRFEAKNIIKLTRTLGKIFEQTNNCSEDTAIELEKCAVVDSANVCMVEAKTEEAKRAMSLFINTENIPKDVCIDYIVRKDDINKKYTASYSTDYMVSILNVLNCIDDHVRISLKEDAPSILETKDLKFFLAPRISSEEEF